ncbi:flagellar biosynthesis repressor FlbT [Gimibacter soli]|uniref:Flagellar biosynthesis repressor FlbT n=1 Tax=Gimibacter soli TaxID=3024400 RepID=A0AAE9XMT6_9PROT|nr:flagellar biosynthesis repressor FlbT [Gimibacter soli]WCL53066.1 flagellar biosynthesis repressor FlbT [Gimibacter soli]
MALKLSLRPEEKLVINGAVIANGDRRANLIVHNKASILREKDIMQQEEANTPARRIYFPIMLMYMDPSSSSQYYDEFVLRMTEFMGAVSTPEVLDMCVEVSKAVMDRNYYKALVQCKKVLKFEADRLNLSYSDE